MITKITMNKIACYRSPAILSTDKKINLVYGLNGTGKSTLSNYLYKTDPETHLHCETQKSSNDDILVYNQSFIRDNFYESEAFPGIFTLSKENKEAESKIKNCETEINKLQGEKVTKSAKLSELVSEEGSKKQSAENKLWEIKGNYSGGDRVLEYCLSGLMGRKEALFNHLIALKKPLEKPSKTIELLKSEISAVQGNEAKPITPIPALKLKTSNLEVAPIFQKEIVGNRNSTVAELITKLGNSDWVKAGLDFLPNDNIQSGTPCPFCQAKTISEEFVKSIKSFFDESYERNLAEIKRLLLDYSEEIKSLPSKKEFEENPYVFELRLEFEEKFNSLFNTLKENLQKIESKIKTPSQVFDLKNTEGTLADLNDFFLKINLKIEDHNQKLKNKEKTLKEIKETFWQIMRWEYDQTIQSFQQTSNELQKKIKDLKDEVKAIEDNVTKQRKIITEQQKNVVNIEEAINNINNGLIELGIDSFRIEKHSDAFYKISRSEPLQNAFLTLSEGEKMIISFLYFRELSKGKKNPGDSGMKKIIIIDDPISSLSHVFIFNIGQMIKTDFFLSERFTQVFVLTHSLYFFYELTDPKHDRRKENQKLFRMVKNSEGSKIIDMNYEEIQNDYHSYWHVVKDKNQPPALIANCMRNIIEYFFNFIEKKDLNNVFLKPSLKQNRFQAFYRYINRESHSLGQNIFDFKEFNYDDFKEGLCLVFKETGYEDHYKEMIK